MCFFLPEFFFGLLWDYAAVLLLCVTFPILFIRAKRKGFSILDSVIAAVKKSAILLVVLVFVMVTVCSFMPGYKAFTLGYWIHAKIWLNTTQVRQWAANQSGSTNFHNNHVPYEQWPSSLKNVAYGAEWLNIDAKTKTVTLVEGGGFGHWGIMIAQTNATNDFGRNYFIRLDKAAWVWHEIQ